MSDQKAAPLDLNVLANLLGMKDIEILQLRYQLATLNAELDRLKADKT